MHDFQNSFIPALTHFSFAKWRPLRMQQPIILFLWLTFAPSVPPPLSYLTQLFFTFFLRQSVTNDFFCYTTRYYHFDILILIVVLIGHRLL